MSGGVGTHNFKPVQNHPRQQPGMIIWRCDKCDSETMFSRRFTEADVNKIMQMRLHCLPPEAFKN